MVIREDLGVLGIKVGLIWHHLEIVIDETQYSKSP